ncbi:DsbA family protein [Streptomyces sp. NBC_00365]|uniref:DsbA family oxidoreductase n=1 Tax=Streptomyces sp. NBC_00365 TaxID=2975726 RepID=UPI002B1CE28B|nr:DsbA family protein [Streptomyces sp. NBC_00365]
MNEHCPSDESLGYRFRPRIPPPLRTTGCGSADSAHAHGYEGHLSRMVLRLLRAALADGEAFDDTATLVRLARACPADHAADAGLGTPSPRGGTPSGVVGDVLDDIRQALAFGVSGLPFCIIDRAYGISGAQPVETILDTLRKAASPFVA